MVVVGLVADFATVLSAAITVADLVGSQAGCFIDRCLKVCIAVGGRFDQENMAIGADGTHHIQVKRDFLCPASVGFRVFGAAVLIDFPKAAVGGRASCQTKLGSVDAQIRLGIRIVEGIYDGHGLSNSSVG